MGRASHVSDGKLMGFADREIGGDRASAIERHLHGCAACRTRLASLQSAAASYEQFHRQVLKPGLAVTPAKWPQLDLKSGVGKSSWFAKPVVWWAGALVAVCLLLVAVYFRGAPQARQMQQLLTEAAQAPPSPHRRIQLSAAGRTWFRPAVLRGSASAASLEHIQALFVKANYSWEDPLSARSFSAWRNRLSCKRDRVTSMAGADGLKRLYRLRTETPDGALRTASLTLRADNLAVVDGAFEFEDRERVTIADMGQDSDARPAETRSAAKGNLRAPEPVEQKVSAADELRVFAALSEIGADVGEPLRVETDAGKQHVLVTGMGIAAAREREIREALTTVPNAIVRFDSAQAPREGARSTKQEAYSADMSAPLRHTLEERAGGAQQLQLITDRALDAGNSLLAQAHALLVLAQVFPPEIEAAFDDEQRVTLRKLRHRHAIAVQQTILQLEEALKPLMKAPDANADASGGTGNEPNASWQAGAAKLFDHARALDESVSRLLAAGYSQQAAESVSGQLPKDLESMEALARWQAGAE